MVISEYRLQSPAWEKVLCSSFCCIKGQTNSSAAILHTPPSGMEASFSLNTL